MKITSIATNAPVMVIRTIQFQASNLKERVNIFQNLMLSNRLLSLVTDLAVLRDWPMMTSNHLPTYSCQKIVLALPCFGCKCAQFSRVNYNPYPTLTNVNLGRGEHFRIGRTVSLPEQRALDIEYNLIRRPSMCTT